jgi:hypothetical protein
MTSTTALHHTTYLVHSLGFTVNYARSLLKEVKEESFAQLPMPNFNHPAFVYGHLAVSANFMLELLGRDDAKVELPFDPEPYTPAATCVEQDGRYSEMNVLVDAFFKTHESVLEVLPSVDPEVFAQANPVEGFSNMMPRVGDAITFMCCSHTMMHLGQISMWRRAMGLGSCF